MKLHTFIVPFLAGAALFMACNNQAKNNDQATDAEQADVLESVPTEDNVGPTAAIPDSARLVDDYPVLSLKESDTYLFEAIKEGDKVTHEFSFTNTGKSPLIISNVQATCGCTTPEYTKTPIKPGDDGIIKVVYNSSGQGVGPKHKTVTVTSNAEQKQMILHVKGDVK